VPGGTGWNQEFRFYASERKGGEIMARSKLHVVPKTSRLCITCNVEEIKEIRKLAIDLEIPEREVLRLALRCLIERYRDTSPQEIMEKGIQCFLKSLDGFAGDSNGLQE
jgi:hypothetical protein